MINPGSEYRLREVVGWEKTNRRLGGRRRQREGCPRTGERTCWLTGPGEGGTLSRGRDLGVGRFGRLVFGVGSRLGGLPGGRLAVATRHRFAVAWGKLAANERE